MPAPSITITIARLKGITRNKRSLSAITSKSSGVDAAPSRIPRSGGRTALRGLARRAGQRELRELAGPLSLLARSLRRVGHLHRASRQSYVNTCAVRVISAD